MSTKDLFRTAEFEIQGVSQLEFVLGSTRKFHLFILDSAQNIVKLKYVDLFDAEELQVELSYDVDQSVED